MAEKFMKSQCQTEIEKLHTRQKKLLRIVITLC